MTAIPPTVATSDTTEPFEASTLGASLTASSLQTSLAWYRDVLGFTVARTFDRGGPMFAASLRAGDVAILLTQDDGARGADRIKGEGISLQLTTSQNIDALAKRVQERGATLESGPVDVMGARAFRLRDPDGFKLVISSPRSHTR
ncbi:MAG TPA: VOC family protein [Gemmatimonadaceae bacterium]|nr:VOC family protein [Gemmatimonadaceae bacterium]